MKLHETKLMEKLFDELLAEEKRGQKYFREAAIYSKDSKVKKVFEILAAEEANHVEVLKSIKTRLDEKLGFEKHGLKSRESMIEYAGEDIKMIEVSLQTDEGCELPSMELFRAQDFHALLETLSVEMVLKYAMKIEYDNAKYIVNFMKCIHSKAVLDLLVQLVNEEKNHFILVENLHKKLSEHGTK